MSLEIRLQKLRQKFAENEIDTIFISQPENRFYLSGFDGSAGFLLITPQDAILATDFRYLEHAKSQAANYRIFRISGNIGEWFCRLVGELGPAKVGFEAGHITFSAYRQLSDALNRAQIWLKLVPVDGVVESLRAVKEAEEVEFITRAVEISDAAFEHIEDKIQPGMSEQEVAWKIESFIRENGSESIPFDIIVASGANSALPHARPSQRRIDSGEPVVIDIGAKVGGYSSDLSRTICVGSPDATFNKIYDTVVGAQLTALAIIKEGMSGDESDCLARTVIGEAGYSDAFGHGLGHGIGLAPHEQPRLCPGSSDVLTSGMVFTVEPGIYLTGWGGVRIEDMVVMEDGKAKVLSRARKIKHDKWQ